jgi:phospholipase/carboxylesterase
VAFLSNRRRWSIVGGFILLVAGTTYWRPWRERLQVIHAGDRGPPTLVLLHGFGSSAEEWLPYSKTVTFLPAVEFLFPQGPVMMVRTDGARAGHAWWDLKLAEHRRIGRPGVDLRDENTLGLVHAAALVQELLQQVGHPVILGGFSQGAMVSGQVAFTSDAALTALVLLSGTPLNEAAWRAGIHRRKGLPVFMAHGRADDVLPFDLAEGLRDELLAAGLDVTFVAFDGGHQIPEEAVTGLRAFLERLRS